MELADNLHRIVSYNYDADGNRASITYPSGKVFNYNYTNRNQVSAILSGANPIVNYGFDPAGNLTSRSLDNGTSTTYSPDAVNRETSVQHALISGPRRFDYAYNTVNDITAVQRDSGPSDGYQYDLTQQIIGFAQTAPLISLPEP